jgi:Protein of unknown function (DUF1574).
MNRKIIRSLSFILLLVFIFGFINQRYKECDYYTSSTGINRFGTISEGIQIANFGSSHGEAGLNYSEFPEYECFNLAIKSQLPTEDYLVMQSYQEYLSEGCVVLIPISYFSLYTPEEEWMDVVFPIYYSILDFPQLKELEGFNLKDLLLYRIFPVLSSKEKFFEIFKPSGLTTYTSPDGEPFGQPGQNTDKNGYSRASMHQEQMEKGAQQEQVESLKKMLILCEQNGWKPILITTPYTESYNMWFSEEQMNGFYEEIALIQKEFPNVPYWDYSHDEDIGSHYEFFRDADHLNQRGARYFTGIVIKRIEDLMLL